jgi:bacterial/archaeal transporter family protein
MPNMIDNWRIYALLAAFFGALTTILAKIGLQNIDANLANAVRTIAIVIIAWGLVIGEGNLGQLTTIPAQTLVFLVGSGVATGLSWLFYFKALQITKAAVVAPIDKSSVLMVILFSTIFLKEPLTLKEVIGGCTIAIGTLLLIL